MSFSIYMITGQKRNLADVLRSLATMIQETNNQRVSINLNLTFETDPEPKPKPLQQGLQPFPNPPTLPKPEPNVSKKRAPEPPIKARYEKPGYHCGDPNLSKAAAEVVQHINDGTLKYGVMSEIAKKYGINEHSLKSRLRSMTGGKTSFLKHKHKPIPSAPMTVSPAEPKKDPPNPPTVVPSLAAAEESYKSPNNAWKAEPQEVPMP